MYKIIDENLKLAGCGINDLTIEQASHFLSQWKNGAKLGTLIVFYDHETGYLVMNQDNSLYDFYLKLVKGYLCTSKKEAYHERFGKKYHEVFSVIDNFELHRSIESDLEILGHQTLSISEDQVTRRVLTTLEKKQIPTCFLISQAYSYGVINGKRKERARKKVV